MPDIPDAAARETVLREMPTSSVNGLRRLSIAGPRPRRPQSQIGDFYFVIRTEGLPAGQRLRGWRDPEQLGIRLVSVDRPRERRVVRRRPGLAIPGFEDEYRKASKGLLYSTRFILLAAR